MHRRKSIRIQEIAEKAGVSVGTVDRALHDRGRVAQKTKDTVMKIAAELGYAVPKTIDRKIEIGVLLPDPNTNSYWEKPLEGIVQAADLLNDTGLSIHLQLFDYNNENDYLQNGHQLLDAKLEGMIVHPKYKEATFELIRRAEQEEMKLAFIDMNVMEIEPDYFIGQNIDACGALVGRLIEISTREKEDIWVVNPYHDERLPISFQRERAVVNFLTKRGQDRSNIVIIDLPLKDKNASSFFEGKDSPKAIYVTNSRVAETYALMKEVQHFEDKETVFIGHDLLEDNKELLKSEKIDFLITQDSARQGREVLENLYKIVKSKQHKKIETLLPPSLVTKENI
ncbi:substrate-binding domain-containing protein [Flammeovirga sp. OC4]|uniref:substrate-binding domain-containing protein n=1 Tax=Flammeovirga sp. OC4 TaxID=1382345 RepID=UPI0005C44732|nr:substrate-binding domain-containing protein [Flammeovirga sp. OC4]